MPNTTERGVMLRRGNVRIKLRPSSALPSVSVPVDMLVLVQSLHTDVRGVGVENVELDRVLGHLVQLL